MRKKIINVSTLNPTILKTIALVLTLSFIFGVFNWKVFFLSDKPNSFEGYMSLTFYILWILYCFYMSYKNVKHFLRFIILYWTIGLGITIFSAHINLYVIAVPLYFIYLTPLYGLLYFFNEASADYFNIAILIIYISGALGYFLGKIKRQAK